MSQQLLSQTAPAESNLTVPNELDSTQSKLVYLYVRTAETCTVDDLQADLDMKKISLYPLLKSLAKKDLITRDGQAYKLN